VQELLGVYAQLGDYYFMNKSVVIIPTYNERHNISRLLEKIAALKSGLDIIVADDGSPDGTADAVKDFAAKNPSENVFLVSRPSKAGLGSAYLNAFDWVKSSGRFYEKIFMMDADFSHDPVYLGRLSEALTSSSGKSSADMAVGSRYVPGGGIEGWPFLRKLVSGAGNFYARLILGGVRPGRYGVRDFTSGFIGMKRDVLFFILENPPRSEGYGFLIEIKFKVLKNGFSVREIPIIFTDRVAGKSKISKKIIWEAFRLVWRLRFAG